MSDEGFPVLPVRLSWEGVTVYPTPADFYNLAYREPQTSHDLGRPDTLVIPTTAWERLQRWQARDWPKRGFTDDQVATVLGFVARGGFTRCTLLTFINEVMYPDDPDNASDWWRIMDRTIRRSKRENRIAWSPHDQCYVALPAWRHKPIHDLRGWNWPKP